MGGGFIQLHRRLLDHPLYKRPGFIRLWTWCLLRTQYKDQAILYRGEKVNLKRGEFTFGRRQAARETGLSDKQIRNLIDLLIREKMITSKAYRRANRFSVFLVENWDEYQISGPTEGPTRVLQKVLQKGQQNLRRESTEKGPTEGPTEGPHLKKYKEIRGTPNGVFSYEQVLQAVHEGIPMMDFERQENGTWLRK